MDYLRTLPAKKGELPVIPVDARAARCRRSRKDELTTDHYRHNNRQYWCCIYG
jgi:hypothetical protein